MDQIREIIQAYSGRRYLKDEDFDVVADPEVVGVYACRVKFRNEEGYTHLLITLDNIDDIDDGVEEVEFTQWPPTSNGRPV